MPALSWRDHARPIIARVLADTRGQDDKAVRAALKAAYPFGERAMHPYKIWNDEIARQRGTKPLPRPAALPEAPDPNQLDIYSVLEADA